MKKIAAFVVLAVIGIAWAETPPRMINFQGKVTDNAGNPLTANRDITVKIYDAPSDGTMLWEETHSAVSVVNGIFSVLLGGVQPLSLPFDKDYWLGVTFGTDSEMTPRKQIVSVGWSLGKVTNEQLPDNLEANSIDLGPGTDDDLTASDVQTLTGGPSSNAESLHTHAGVTTHFESILDLAWFIRAGGSDFSSLGSNTIIWDLAHRSEYSLNNTVGIFGDDDGSSAVANRGIWLGIDTSSVTEDCDYTGLTLDPDWTTSTENFYSHVVFDAAADEMDLDVRHDETGNAALSSLATYANVMVHVKVRALDMNSPDNGLTYFGLYTGNKKIGMTIESYSGDVSCQGITNTDLTSEPGTVELRLTVINEYVKGEYMTADAGGSGSWVTVFEGYVANANANGNVRVEIEKGGGSLDNTCTASVYGMTVCDRYWDVGSVANATNIGLVSTAGLCEVRDVGRSLPTDTSMSMGASSDGGGNYYDADPSGIALLTVRGVLGRLKATLQQSTTGDDATPVLRFAGGVFK